MRVRLEPDFTTMTTRIYLYEARENGGIQHVIADPWWKDVEIPLGAKIEKPSLVLPDDWLREIVREASGILPPTDATTRHLEDAVTIRNRLLDAIFPPQVSSRE